MPNQPPPPSQPSPRRARARVESLDAGLGLGISGVLCGLLLAAQFLLPQHWHDGMEALTFQSVILASALALAIFGAWKGMNAARRGYENLLFPIVAILDMILWYHAARLLLA